MTDALRMAAEALRPFARMADQVDAWRAASEPHFAGQFDASDLRAARETLAAVEAELARVLADHDTNRERAQEIVRKAIAADGEDPGPLIDLITEELDRRPLASVAEDRERLAYEHLATAYMRLRDLLTPSDAAQPLTQQECEDAIRALRSPVSGGEGWRPIETAPKDSKPPLLLASRTHITIGYPDSHDLPDPATHWQPLPARP